MVVLQMLYADLQGAHNPPTVPTEGTLSKSNVPLRQDEVVWVMTMRDLFDKCEDKNRNRLEKLKMCVRNDNRECAVQNACLLFRTMYPFIPLGPCTFYGQRMYELIRCALSTADLDLLTS